MANDINKQYLLEKDTRANTALNYAFLRAKGIDLLQQYSGNTWSDFNLHDPGVTILEYLCFGLTDLAYRTNFPIEDILTGKSGKINSRKNLFFTADQVLTTNPVTINDFRRLIIDNIPELYNVWLEPLQSQSKMQYVKGIYKVIIQLSDETIGQFDEEPDKKKVQRQENAIIEKVKNIVHSSRNIGEDFEEFTLLEKCNIEIEADISVDRNKFAEDVLADIYAALYKALNPELRFYSEKELLNKGYPHEKIHEGPPLLHGFIIEEELKPRTRFIDPADLLKAITEIEGVKLVQHLVVKVNNIEYDNAVYTLQESEFPYLVFDKEKPAIHLFNENYAIPVKPNLFFNLLSKKIDSGKRHYIKKAALGDDYFPIESKYRNLQDYHSIQNLFPVIYKLNMYGIDNSYTADSIDNTTLSEIAKAKQLKAYLMLFEQLMANYLSQLTNIDNLFSASVNEATAQTYFFQPLYAVPGVENIISAFFSNKEIPTQARWDKFMADQHNAYQATLQAGIETDDTFIKRKTRAIDHMLARFNCAPQKFPVEIFVQTYNWKSSNNRITAELLWKAGLLENIIPLTRDRNLAYNYYKKNSDKSRKGFEERMARLLFIQDVKAKALSGVPEKLDPAFSILPVEVPADKKEAVQTFRIVWENEAFDIVQQNTGTPEDATPEATPLAFTPLPATGVSFLKDALNEDHYRVIPADKLSNPAQLLIYKTPQQTNWQLVGRFPGSIAAHAALHRFIERLTKISTSSEGFHVVEHVLLKPPSNSRFFGFNFFDTKGHILCRQSDWLTFAEREKTLAALNKVASMANNSDYAAVAKYLDGLCDINTEHDEGKENFVRPSVFYYADKALAEKAFRRLIRNLQLFNKPAPDAMPRLQSMVRVTDNNIMPEDLFNFRITVVFPAWPARFQDPVFRRFAEKLFIANSPAYMRLSFKWLNITAMKTFENKYLQWQDALNTFKFSAGCIDHASELVSFLHNQQ